MSTLTNIFIADSYKALLHFDGAELPSSGQVDVYDGNGTASSLKLGKACEGATICGTLTVDELVVGNLVDIIHPVGSVYLSTVATNPSTIFGGVWARIADGKYLAGVGTGADTNGITKTFNSGDNLGEYQHILTIDELPRHRHDLTHPDTGEQFYVTNDLNYTGGGADTFRSDGPGNDKDGRYYPYTNYVGGSTAHNISPPSYGLYVWKRTS